jgi:hypothetical protein
MSATSDGTLGKVKWTGDWIAFADAMLQIGILSRSYRGLSLPTTIELLRCDPRIMNMNINEEKIVDVAYDPKTNIGCAHGIEIRGMLTTSVPRKAPSEATLEKYLFIPNNEECAIDAATKSEMEEYIAACQKVAADIERNLKIATKQGSFEKVCVEKFLSDETERYSLIKVLDNIRKNLTSPTNYWELVEKVILISICLKLYS